MIPHGHLITVEALDRYPERIDVRSPSEYAEDHLPGALSHPVLSDAERASVGTLHAREGAFVAKRMGAAIVSRNVAQLLESAFADRPREWSPLVYCWRGGKRSGALTHVLNEIGWHAVQLQGGYRAFRRHVRTELQVLPARLDLRVVCGLTGSGKSRFLWALASEGAQVLDLEQLAAHRGSLLGDLPDAPQPSQKAFETLLFEAMRCFDTSRPVYVESESTRIGGLQVPSELLAAMREARCVRIELPLSLRVELLREEYAHFIDDAEHLAQRLSPLTPLLGQETISRWITAAQAGDWDALVRALLAEHYDLTYARSITRNFPRSDDATIVAPTRIDADHYRELARALIADEQSSEHALCV
ncbi:MAG: tRNA 2-selenouridine(34) synthase MnmH [Pseudomonadota bacterium]|nr:tRNA 2-selenouridine(34) synthase MnmH [Pseudomonadota bacterium]